jgi:hypothetical protein
MAHFNDDPFQPWNDPMRKNDPFAPHNGHDSDNPFKPWNNPLGRESDLDDNERRDYGLPKRSREEDF